MARNDTKLVIGTRSFDFRELFDAYFPIVVEQATFFTGDRASAEDVAQEVFFKLYNDPPKEFTNLRGWLSRVAARLSLNYLKGEGRRRKREASAAAPDAAFDESERYSEVQSVRRVLEKLPKNDALLRRRNAQGVSRQRVATQRAVGNRGAHGTLRDVRRALGGAPCR
ncbi:MAG: hypothetical protein M1335_01355 [Chloroflexi bacterium]|nr:hypothetical protein [Chloroflexota bacterium]